ncbi:MAG: IS1595 family transposase [Acidimicrobiales bacterium]
MGWDVDGGRPVAGRHYPGWWPDFEAWFPTEDAAREYLMAVRFRGGWVCPKCGSSRLGEQRDGRLWCAGCRRWSTVTTGTALDHTRVGCRLWLMVCWQVTATKVGMSALSLANTVGVHYATAWSMLHKLRAVMDQDGRNRLVGDVEVDETFVGGRDAHTPGGRLHGRKQVVLVACERVTSSEIGRIRLARAPDASAPSLRAFIEATVEPGSVVLTDGWPPYATAFAELEASGHGYTHKVVVVSGRRAHEELPHVHRVAALLKRWLLGTHQGSVEAPHLDAYFDEFVFRFNRRHSSSRGLVFFRLVCALVDNGPLTRAEIGQRRAAQSEADRAHTDHLAATTRQRANTLRRVHRHAARQGASEASLEPAADDDPF